MNCKLVEMFNRVLSAELAQVEISISAEYRAREKRINAKVRQYTV